MATAIDRPTENLLIPIRDSAVGPVTARRTRTTLTIYAMVAFIGFLPTLLDAHHHWRALGMGLAIPGGGCLFYGHGWLFAASFLSFLFGLVLWFGTANALAPPTVWLLTLMMVFHHNHSDDTPWGPAKWVALGIVLVPFVGIAVIRQIDLWRGRALAKKRNEYLSEPETVLSAEPAQTQDELSEEDLAVLRYSLNRALQPVDEFNGFQIIDQIKLAALRYQLNWMSYGLSLMQYNYTPAFHGYVSEAQRLAIDKMRDRKVWKFWRLENMWGNLDLNPDPIVRDNIMYSAYLGTMMGAYMSATGDRDYQPRKLLSA